MLEGVCEHIPCLERPKDCRTALQLVQCEVPENPVFAPKCLIYIEVNKVGTVCA